MARKRKDPQMRFEDLTREKIAGQEPPPYPQESQPPIQPPGPAADRGPTAVPTAEEIAARAEFQPGDGPPTPPFSLQGKSVWVVDTHALIHQLYHAMPEMASPSGSRSLSSSGFCSRSAFPPA